MVRVFMQALQALQAQSNGGLHVYHRLLYTTCGKKAAHCCGHGLDGRVMAAAIHLSPTAYHKNDEPQTWLATCPAWTLCMCNDGVERSTVREQMSLDIFDTE
jgi:hypothetical protein